MNLGEDKKHNSSNNEAPKIVQNDGSDKSVLRQNAPKVEVDKILGNKIQEIISDMKKALQTQNDGVALAAPQIGISLRIFVVNPDVYRNLDNSLIDMSVEEISKLYPTVFINPEIIKMSKDRKKMEEGCLSVRPWYGKVKRASRATVKAIDENGREFEIEGSGLLAQIFQHEIDHLDGILFIDKAKDLRELPMDNN